jgi:hypothetical protein
VAAQKQPSGTANRATVADRADGANADFGLGVLRSCCWDDWTGNPRIFARLVFICRLPLRFGAWLPPPNRAAAGPGWIPPRAGRRATGGWFKQAAHVTLRRRCSSSRGSRGEKKAHTMGLLLPALLLLLALATAGTSGGSGVQHRREIVTAAAVARVEDPRGGRHDACDARRAEEALSLSNDCGEVALLLFPAALPPAGVYFTNATLRVRASRASNWTSSRSAPQRQSLVLEITATAMDSTGSEDATRNVAEALTGRLETLSPIAWATDQWLDGEDYVSPDLRALLARSTSTESTSTGHYRDLLLIVRSPRGHAQRGIHTNPDGGEPTLEIGFDEFPACAPNGSTACHAQCIPDCSVPSRCVPEELLCGELIARHDERRVRVAGVDLRCHRETELADQIDCERTSSTTVDSAAYLDAARRRRAALSNELTLLGLLGILVACCCFSAAMLCCRGQAVSTRSVGRGGSKKGRACECTQQQSATCRSDLSI